VVSGSIRFLELSTGVWLSAVFGGTLNILAIVGCFVVDRALSFGLGVPPKFS
jgi:hypothetical protein